MARTVLGWRRAGPRTARACSPAHGARNGPGARPPCRRSTSTRPAGKSVIIATHDSRMAVPAMKPSSCIPRKSVSMRTKNVPAAVTAPSSMPGPLRAAVISIASLQAAPEEQLLLVAEEEVDAVVDADADHDRDEHHREERQVPDHQRGDPDRPAEAHGEDQQHEHRLAHTDEGQEQQGERQREREQGGALTVPEGRHHLVVRRARACRSRRPARRGNRA